jgi:hypothetical protein
LLDELSMHGKEKNIILVFSLLSSNKLLIFFLVIMK